jgi:hypothetical protein
MRHERTFICSCRNLTYWTASSSIVLMSTCKWSVLSNGQYSQMYSQKLRITNYKTVRLTFVPLGINCCSVFSFSLILSLLFCSTVWQKPSENKISDSEISVQLWLTSSDLCINTLWILWRPATTSWTVTLFQNSRLLIHTNGIIFRDAAPRAAVIDKLGIGLIIKSIWT